ncbi:MAG: outer membrane protein assembly factor BamA [Planctomycetes bacterium]|nr:outer membrane protein assembly factor BamA [Planctomycetota bacterium]
MKPMQFGGLLRLCALIAVGVFALPSAQGQQGTAEPSGGQTGATARGSVVDIRFEGLTESDESYALSVIRTQRGQAFDAAAADTDITRLLATGRFADVRYETASVAGGVLLTFVVAERPRISAIEFVGNDKFPERKLRKEIAVKIGDALDAFNIREGAAAVKRLYEDAGYGQIVVTFDNALLGETGELIYTIEEGPRLRVEEIAFEGNTSIDAKQLSKKITTKRHRWIFSDGKFDEETVETDAATIQAFYRAMGFLDARAGYRIDMLDSNEDIVVTFTIVEGDWYEVESVEVFGNEVFSTDQLFALVTLQTGEPILQDKLEESARAIQKMYGERGYIFSIVAPVRVFSDTPGLVRVSFEIVEGEQIQVGRVVVRGNERTRDKVIRRAVELFPDDVYNLTKAKEGEENLRATQIFQSARVTPVGDLPGVRDVLVTIDETQKAGDFIFGFGVTSNSGLVGTIMLDIRNFDLFDTPRSFSEFIKLRSFYGGGQRLRIEIQPGTQLNRFRIDFTEPYLFDKPIRFDTSLYFFQRSRDDYNERRVGANVSFGKRLKKGFLKDWYGELALRVENIGLNELDPLVARDIRDDEGSTFQTSVKVTLVRDRTDNRFVPTTGDRTRVSYEQFGVLGGDSSFGKLTGSYTRHFTLKTDELDRKSVLSLRGVAGVIVGDAPVFDRFYAGGIGSVRGFQFRGITPRQGLNNDEIGGEFMLLFSTEYSFPIFSDTLRGVVFADMGTVESDYTLSDWRVSLGTGIKLKVDYFGPVPLEFDIAAPVIRNEDDQEQVFSFFIGAAF